MVELDIQSNTECVPECDSELPIWMFESVREPCAVGATYHLRYLGRSYQYRLPFLLVRSALRRSSHFLIYIFPTGAFAACLHCKLLSGAHSLSGPLDLDNSYAFHCSFCRGRDTYGVLGDGKTGTLLKYPTLSGNGLNFMQFSLGVNHQCGIIASGVIYCWGEGDQGMCCHCARCPGEIHFPRVGALTHLRAVLYRYISVSFVQANWATSP